MTNQHPVTPPPELVQQWLGEQYGVPTAPGEATSHVATQAARWGADQELEACCEWLDRNNQWAKVDIDELRDARRPKPPSLKEQALKALDHICVHHLKATDHECTIRKALEALPND